MIEKAFLQFRGIGPKAVEKLQQHGYQNWQDVILQPQQLPLSKKQTASILTEIETYQDRIQAEDIQFFCNALDARDKWRILADYYELLSFFDIETNGYFYGDNITVITCLHKNRLYKFVNGENLDDFLYLLEEISLLASFNGTNFDIPIIQQYFHINELPCAHIDLRWICYHAGYKSGLKRVEKKLGIRRPAHLIDVDGQDAIILWHRWQHRSDTLARKKLIEYCALDSLSLKLLAAKILKLYQCPKPIETEETLWSFLQEL